MTAQLQNALRELSELKAKGVPSVSAIENAKDGSKWNGTLAGTGTWKLIKNSATSFTTNTSVNKH